MPAVAHIVMHLSLCSAMAHSPSGTAMQVTMHAVDHTGRLTFDRNFSVVHGESDIETVDFDAPYGTYRVKISAPKFGCNAGDYLVIRPPHERNVKETLVQGPPTWPQPTILLGTAPQAFLYAQPTFVLLDAKTECGQEVDQTLPANITVEYDPDSFFVNIYRMPDQAPESRIVALQISSATGDYQYVNLKVKYPDPWDGWPQQIQFNLHENALDGLATMDKGVLLCPKLYKTTAG